MIAFVWSRRVQRTKNFRRAKQVLHRVPVERRNRGGPRITWKDTVWKDIEPKDMAWDDVSLKAVDRDE